MKFIADTTNSIVSAFKHTAKDFDERAKEAHRFVHARVEALREENRRIHEKLFIDLQSAGLIPFDTKFEDIVFEINDDGQLFMREKSQMHDHMMHILGVFR